MNIPHRALKALSDAIWMDTWPAQYIENEIIKNLTKNSKRIVKLAALTIEVSPLLKKKNLFSRLERERRIEWLNNLNTKGIAYNMLSILEFLLSSVYFVNEKHALKINYSRKPLTRCIQPKARMGGLGNDKVELKQKYDVIVIGSGAGGSVAAWRIASAGLNVAIFEAGPEPINIANDHPVSRATTYYWDNGLTFTIGNPAISLPFGKVLGGTVTVNSGTIFRIPQKALTKWREISGVNIYWTKLEKSYETIEAKLNVQTIPEELLGNNAKVMRSGAEKLGLNHYPVKRPIKGCCGAGECAFVCPHNGKIDMRLSFLPEGKRNGLEIYCDTLVERIIRRGGKVVGVVVNIGGHRKYIESTVVVISSGALNTPDLLKTAGVNNKNIGKHLHIHPAAGVTALMNREVYGWRGTMQSYCVDELFNEYHTLLLATFPPPGIGYSAGSIPLNELDKYPYLASIGVQCSDDDEGIIPSFRLFGIAKYNISEDDLEKVKKGIILAAEILLAAGAEKVYLPLKRMVEVEKLTETKRTLEKIDKEAFKLSAYHPMSTARMGCDETVGVVDERGRVFGLENLYVADASILPSTTYVNPQLTINALSLMIAEYILESM